MNSKKFISTIAAGVIAATTVATPVINGAVAYSSELESAYTWAYDNGVTTVKGIDNANMMGNLTRVAMAKMLANYAINKLGRTPDTSITCNFSDVSAKMDADYDNGVTKACQLGIMGRDEGKVASSFNPNGIVTRAQFGTALSRVLWPNQVKDTNPYYVNHLNALKKAGIMTQINPDQKEVRGYVMIMLQRSAGMINNEKTEECSVAQQFLCILEEGDCPEACKDVVKKAEKETDPKDEKEEKIKSGKLIVKATAAEGKKAIKNGGVSDLDTITLKASETITVDSITLERFGYSTPKDVANIWLEDEDGNKITDPKSLSANKDTVTLKVKKEYRDMKATNAITVVLETAKYSGEYGPSVENNQPGSTIGFKVTAVDASAKDLDLSDYDPYTYDLTDYNGSKIQVNVKGTDKDYNYTEGEFYEVSRIKVRAGGAMLNVNGMTLTNKGVADNKDTGDDETVSVFDLDEFVSKVKVTADGEEVRGLSYNVTKDNEIVLSWNAIEVAINKDVQIVVSIAMEGFDEFGKAVRLTLADTGDLNATEKKTGARVTFDNDPDAAKVYTFNGSKIKLSNTKLASTIEAAQGAPEVVIAQGEVTVGEEIKIPSIVFEVSEGAEFIDEMHINIAGEPYDASPKDGKITFTNVHIEKSGKIEISVDIVDEEEAANQNIKFKTTSINKTIFEGATYVDSRNDVKSENEVSGSISLSSIKVQASKASLKNEESKTVEFTQGETSERVTVFKGTYTAKKSDITLKEFAIAGSTTDIAKII